MDQSKKSVLATAISTVQLELSSDLTDDILQDIKSIYMISPTQTSLFLVVNGFIHSAYQLKLLTNIGLLELNGTELTFTDTTQEMYFQSAGFDISSTKNGRRKLASTPPVIGTSTSSVRSSTTSPPTVSPTNKVQ